MALEKTGIELVAERLDEFKSQIDDASDALAEFDSTGQTVSDNFGAFETIITGALLRVGEVAIEFAINAGQAIADFATDAFEGALEAEEGFVRLQGAIKRAGEEAPISEEEALALADSLKGLAGGSDDAVIAAQAVLLKFQSIGKDEFPKALQASLDLAAVLGTDVPSAAEQLGRALGNPEAASRLLRQAGIFLTDEEKELLKQFSETGEEAKAQQFILDKLSQTTAGAAEDMAGTTSGQFAILKESIADAGESIAASFLPVIKSLFEQYIQPNLPLLEEASDAIATFVSLLLSTGDLGDAFDSLFEFEGVGNILTALGIDYDTLANVTEFFQPVIDGFNSVKTAIVDSWPAVQTTLQAMGQTLQDTFTTVSPEIVSNIGGMLEQLAVFWSNHGETVLSVVTVLWNGLVLTIGGALTLLSGAIESVLIFINNLFSGYGELFKGNWQGALDSFTLALSLAALNMLQSFDVFFESILGLLGTNLSEFRAQWQANWDMLLIILDFVTASIELAIGRTFTKVVTTIKSSIQGVLDWLFGLVTKFVEIGNAWIDGIVNGIMQKVGFLTDIVVKSITDIMDKARETLAISSPSKVTAKLIGEPFAEGIAQGILNSAGKVGAAASAVVMPPVSAQQYSSSSVTNVNTTIPVSANNGLDVELIAMKVASYLSGA